MATEMAKTRSFIGFETFSAYILEAGLDEELRAVCLTHRVTLKEVYLDTRGTSVHAARMEMWWRLANMGKSLSEIGRLFARDVTSIMHAMRRLREISAEQSIPIGTESVTIVARAVVASNQKNWSTVGQAAAAANNAKPAKRGP